MERILKLSVNDGIINVCIDCEKKIVKCVQCQLDLITNNNTKQCINFEDKFDYLPQELQLVSSKLFTNLKRTPWEIIWKQLKDKTIQ